MITLLRQPTKHTCGQTCVAMLLGCSIETAINLVGHARPTQMYELLRAINTRLAVPLRENKFYRFPMAPEVLTALWRCRQQDGWRSHWMVIHAGEVFDPAGDCNWPAVSHVPIPLDQLRRGE